MDTSITRQTTGDGADTLYSARYQQTYHSRHGALVEAEHIFLEGSGIKKQLAAGLSSQILEVGFGAGLNFLLTTHYSRAANSPIHYVALEANLLPAATLAQLNYGELLTDVADIRRKFLAWRTSLPHTLPAQTLRWTFGKLIRLELILGDAAQTEMPHRGYQAIYHDPFSPDANPELWTEDFFTRLCPLLEPGGKLVTYSVKGSVRRALHAAGFQVQKQPGPPGKLEMLVARRKIHESTNKRIYE